VTFYISKLEILSLTYLLTIARDVQLTERSKGSVYKPVHIKQEEMVASNKV